eukprot:4354170-Amphidinium_carterae.1
MSVLFVVVLTYRSFRQQLTQPNNPEVSDSLGHCLPSKVLIGGLMLSMSSCAQVGHFVGFQVALKVLQ